ncbi:phosphoenolpyruvate/phosphate translocator 2, chloroplastic-like isoform X1 [Acetobacter orientalis]|uniref:Phosphoenolpyruvate/phosphate translocator 2, chloroplastic-like isoform X1 n=1 Tax=Acetobacter orientalis TaxID=146474 RepID=A0A2Z5ZIF7_9PROT|nr:phosphoenolpyruvate/phosphate translocator 2, chloroplastic-like isoform X1 [Acetobacter orientalis]
MPAPGWLAFWPELDAAGLVSSGLRLLNKNTPAMLAAVLRQRIYKYL